MYHIARDARGTDFSSHVQAQLRALDETLQSRDAILAALRGAHATLDPQKVAGWLVRQIDAWIPAPCWVVVAADVNGQLAVLAEKGLVPAFGPSVWAVATWVITQGVEFAAADLSKDRRGGGIAAGTTIAFPLICRGRTVGALVGFDPLPSATTPSLGQPGTTVLGIMLEPGAIALGNALTVQKAEALSVTDDLTGVSNPRFVNLVLRREEKLCARTDRPLSLLFIDMDDFKKVNTQHGHLAGSKALVEVAAVIKSCARETDVVGRFGGDEFSVVLPDTGRQGAIFVAERICDRIRAFEFLKSDGISVHLTASIGVATLPDVTTSAEELLRAADRAMYRIKNAGKNDFYVAERDK